MAARTPSAMPPPTTPPSRPSQSRAARKRPSAARPSPISSGWWWAWRRGAARRFFFFTRAGVRGRTFVGLRFVLVATERRSPQADAILQSALNLRGGAADKRGATARRRRPHPLEEEFR